MTVRKNQPLIQTASLLRPEFHWKTSTYQMKRLLPFSLRTASIK